MIIITKLFLVWNKMSSLSLFIRLFMHNHNGQVQDPLNIIIYTMIEMWIFID